MNNLLFAQAASIVDRSQHPYARGSEAPQPTFNVSLEEAHVLRVARDTWIAYRNSPAGKRKLESMKTMDLQMMQAEATSLFNGTVFQVVLDLLHGLDKVGFLPKSFTMALCAEGDFGIGLQVAAGLAFGTDSITSVSSSEFLGIGLIEGLVGEIEFGAQFGFWNSPPTEIGGFCLASAIEDAEGVGLNLTGYYELLGEKPEPLGVSVTVEVGAGAGVDEMEYYLLVLDDQELDLYQPTFQVPKSNLMIIKQIHCVHTSDDGPGDEDEVYFTFRADHDLTYRFPPYDYFSMKDEKAGHGSSEGEWSTWKTGRSVWYRNKVEINLYDEDTAPNDDDLLGTLILGSGNGESPFPAVGASATYTFTGSPDKTNYNVTIAVVPT